MIRGPWRERLWWWLPALVVLILNLFAFVWFQAVYSGAARRVDQQLEKRGVELREIQETLGRQHEVLERVRINQQQVKNFYASRLSTREERLTSILREVRDLASTAGLEPSVVDYPEDQLTEFGLEKRWVNFGVTGSYVQLRRFINLLEMSDSFLTLEDVNLNGRAEDAELRISLRISTLFSTRVAPAADAAEAAS